MKNLILSFVLLALSCALPSTASAMTGARVSPRDVHAQAISRRNREVEQANYTRTNDTAQLYRNTKFGITMRFPKDWQATDILERDGNVTTVSLFLSPLESTIDSARENVNIVVEDLVHAPLSLEEYTTQALAHERALFADFTMLSSTRTMLAGSPAQDSIYTAKFTGQTLQFEQVWMARSHRIYVWTLATPPSTFDAFSLAFHRMLSTVTIR